MSKLRPNQKVLRCAVLQRDHGICATCGYYCEALRLQLLALPYYERELERRRLGIPRGRTSYFDVHHVKALVEGGTDALSNVVSLCWRCHPKATATLTSDLAHARAAGRAPVSEHAGLEEIFG